MGVLNKRLTTNRVPYSSKEEYLRDLALRVGLSPQDAGAISKQPDVEDFLRKRERRLEKQGALLKDMPSRESKTFDEGVTAALADLVDVPMKMLYGSNPYKNIDYALGGEEPSIPPAPPMASPSVLPPERATDFMTPKGMTTPGMATGATLPVGDALPTDIPEPAAPPAPGAPQGTDTSGRRMALALMEGLTRAGAEASNVPGLLELMAGKGRGPTDQTNAEMLRKARELDMQREESANSPLVQMVKKAFGVDVKNEEQAKQVIAAEQAKSGLATEAFKRGEGPAAEKMQREQKQQAAIEGVQKKRGDIQKLASFKKMEESFQMADSVLNLLETGNVSDIRVAGVQLARAAGEVGNLAQNEQKSYTDMPYLKGIANQIKEFAQSEPTEENRDRLRELARHYKEQARMRMDDLLDRETESYLEANPEIDADFVRKQFGSLAPKGTNKSKFWATVTKPIGDYEVGEPIEVTEEQFEKYKANLER